MGPADRRGVIAEQEFASAVHVDAFGPRRAPVGCARDDVGENVIPAPIASEASEAE